MHDQPLNYEKYKFLKVQKRANGIAILSINRPELLNAVDPETHRDLEYIWIDLARDKDIKAIVMTGEGKAFSAGGDLKRMAKRAGTLEGLKHALNAPAGTKRIFQNLLEVPQPIIAAINGDAIGIAATIALFCDISYIADDAWFGDPHVKVGMVAGDGGAVVWPLLIGHQRAKEFLLTGRMVKGADAARMNLINHAAPKAEVLDRAIAMAEEIARQPYWAVHFTKLSVNKWLKEQVSLILDASAAYESLSMLTEDFKEATNAFVEKRKPDYKGY